MNDAEHIGIVYVGVLHIPMTKNTSFLWFRLTIIPAVLLTSLLILTLAGVFDNADSTAIESACSEVNKKNAVAKAHDIGKLFGYKPEQVVAEFEERQVGICWWHLNFETDQLPEASEAIVKNLPKIVHGRLLQDKSYNNNDPIELKSFTQSDLGGIFGVRYPIEIDGRRVVLTNTFNNPFVLPVRSFGMNLYDADGADLSVWIYQTSTYSQSIKINDYALRNNLVAVRIVLHPKYTYSISQRLGCLRRHKKLPRISQ